MDGKMNILRFVIPKSLVLTLAPENTVRQALERMRFHRYTAVPAVDADGRYRGTIRTDDLLNYFLTEGTFDRKRAEDRSVSDIIDPSYSKALSHSASLGELIEQVKEHNFVPVVDDRECFIGIILRRDVLNYLFNYYKESGGEI